MTATETKAKKAAIIGMMHGYPSSQDRISEATINAYLEAVAGVSADAVQRSCTQFLTGKVDGHNNAFMPSAAELSANAAQWDYAIATLTANQELAKLEKVTPYKIGTKPPPPMVPLGPTNLEVDGIMRDLTGYSHEEKEVILRTGKMPEAKPEIGNAPKPQLRKM